MHYGLAGIQRQPTFGAFTNEVAEFDRTAGLVALKNAIDLSYCTMFKPESRDDVQPVYTDDGGVDWRHGPVAAYLDFGWNAADLEREPAYNFFNKIYSGGPAHWDSAYRYMCELVRRPTKKSARDLFLKREKSTPHLT